jgi:hypothetical protein
MDELVLLRGAATVMTILAAAMVAANWNARLTVAGFALFILASIAWMLDGWFEEKSSLVIQNAVLLLINILGVYRWLPRAEAETR